MRMKILAFLVKFIARSFNARYYNNVDLLRSFEQLEREGLSIHGSGFIVPGPLGASGLYFVEYKHSIMENRYGRYN